MQLSYAAQLLNRSHGAATDNRTANELHRGKPYRRTVSPFGESVMYTQIAANATNTKIRRPMGHWNPLWIGEAKHNMLVGTTSGVFKVNCIKRLPRLQSSDPELVKSIVGTPWDPTPGREARVLDYEPLTVTEPINPEAELPPRIPNRDDSAFDGTRITVRLTDGCIWRIAAREGRVAHPQSLEYRDPIENAILSEESH